MQDVTGEQYRPPVHLEITDTVATITFDRPAVKNALDAECWSRLLEHLDAITDTGIRALILCGANGDFCSGADTAAPRRADKHPLEAMRQVTDPLIALHELPIPVIAKVDGVAVGAGWSLALCADFVVATPRSRFSQIFAKRGLSIDTGASWLLPRAVGLQTAKRLAYLADIIDAREAYELGLVTRLAEADELDSVTTALAERLTQAPPIALQLDKTLLDHSHQRTFREAIAAENVAQTVNFGTDAPVARAALATDRPVEFAGRWQL